MLRREYYGNRPSTKNYTTSLSDPLLDVVANDEDIYLLGVIVVGTPQDNEDKNFVGTRAAAWAEAMRADSAILSCDGWETSRGLCKIQ